MQQKRGYAYRIARRTLYRLQRQLVATTVRFHALQRAWLRAANSPHASNCARNFFHSAYSRKL